MRDRFDGRVLCRRRAWGCSRTESAGEEAGENQAGELGLSNIDGIGILPCRCFPRSQISIVDTVGAEALGPSIPIIVER